MNPNIAPIVRTARRHLDDALRSLDPDAAPTPFIIVGGPHGMAHIGLHSLDDDDFVDTAATVVPAFIVLNEAVEVVLVAFLHDPGFSAVGSPECAVIAHWAPQRLSLSVAPVTRRNVQPPVIGSWEDTVQSTIALEAVDNGVQRGTELAHRLWTSEADDLRQEIDLIRITATTEDNDVLPLTVDALRRWCWLD